MLDDHVFFPDPDSEVMMESLTFTPGDKVTISFTAYDCMRVVFLKLKGFQVEKVSVSKDNRDD